MTEEDAKTKWCPFARVALMKGIAANRTASMGTGAYADITEETRCLGSGCMAWRWIEHTTGSGSCGLGAMFKGMP